MRFAGRMDHSYSELDLFVRGGASAALLIGVALFAIRPGARHKALPVSALCFGVFAYLLVSSPNLPFSNGALARGLVMIAGTVPVLVYWAGVELFLDRATYHWWQASTALAVVLGAWLAPVFPLAEPLRGGLVVLLYIHLLYIVFSSAADDLVETRRRFRRWFLVIMALLGGGIAVVELFRLDVNMPAFIFPLHAAAFLLLTTVFLVWSAQVSPDVWVASTAKPPSVPALSPAEAAVLTRVEEAMRDGVWQEEGLTIGQLAARISAPEHRVRRAINQGLSFRNFASFINKYRVEAAKEVLLDPHQADTAILSIAYDVGFASLGPFNRTFRDITGQSPTEFRRTKIPPSSPI